MKKIFQHEIVFEFKMMHPDFSHSCIVYTSVRELHHRLIFIYFNDFHIVAICVDPKCYRVETFLHAQLIPSFQSSQITQLGFTFRAFCTPPAPRIGFRSSHLTEMYLFCTCNLKKCFYWVGKSLMMIWWVVAKNTSFLFCFFAQAL